MRPTDIETLVQVGRPTIAPDGAFAIFATSRPSIEANRALSRLWRVDLPAGSPRPLTRGSGDRAPQLSPSGDVVGFLRPDTDGRTQLFVVEASGGEPVQVTDRALGVMSFAWAPDGGSLVFVSPVGERGRYGDVDGLGPDAESPRRITGIRWHANGAGYIVDRPTHLFVVDTPDLDAEPLVSPAPAVRPEGAPAPTVRVVPNEARALTSGELSYGSPVFAADGHGLFALVSEIERDRADLRSRVVEVSLDAAGASERVVVDRDANLTVDDLIVTTAGDLALLASSVGDSGTDFVAACIGLHVRRDGAWIPLTDPETIDLGDPGSHVTALADGSFLAQSRTRGRVQLIRVAADGTIEVLRDDVEVTGHAATRDGATIVAAVADVTSFGELELVRFSGEGVGRRITALGRTPIAAIPSEREVAGRDGYPVHGWVAVPEGEGPFPVILQIHGGPYAHYGVHLFDETQVLVAAGYAVVYANPRGSAGYGRAHGRSIRHRMGTVDFADVIDFLDAAIEADSRLDGSRVGVMGGSYGGYLTAWTIAHDHRFAAAIVERGFLDPVSFAGTSDIGSFFGDEYVGVDPVEIEAQSPMAAVSLVRTPTLVVHSELDFRCPLEQATRYYTALKRQGVDAEMLVFPGENHELTRAGSPRHRVERFEAVLDWWSRYLPTG